MLLLSEATVTLDATNDEVLKPLQKPQLFANMKFDLLSRWVARMGLAWGDFVKQAVMFDDNDDVIDTLTAKGLTTIDARKYS